MDDDHDEEDDEKVMGVPEDFEVVPPATCRTADTIVNVVALCKQHCSHQVIPPVKTEFR